MTDVTIAMGDGIGPEIMKATLRILEAAKTNIRPHFIEVGEQVYLRGNESGISTEAWNTIRNNKIFLKAPITTPQGGGYKSLNVTMRKSLGLFANVRPCMSLTPYIFSKHPDMDLVVVRENEEDLYAGIEHQQTDEVVQCLKLISRPGCERIVRYAFEYAKAYNRKKISCFTKDNIMKQTDGLFHQVFKEISAAYPEIETEHLIVDIGAARLADSPERFDVVLVPNLYGDILSDITAQISGSVGLAGSSNVGMTCAMFEAIHGSAPDIAGKNIANPSGLLNGAIMMLTHIGQGEVAATIKNAWLKTLEDGTHTADIYNEAVSKQKVGTSEFADAVIANLGNKPEHLPEASFSGSRTIHIPAYKRAEAAKKDLVGVDLFVHWAGSNADELAEKLLKLETDSLELCMITNRGIKVWPEGMEETFCTDHWRCRYESKDGSALNNATIVELMNRALSGNIDVIKTENLYKFDGKQAYSMGQGQTKRKQGNPVLDKESVPN